MNTTNCPDCGDYLDCARYTNCTCHGDVHGGSCPSCPPTAAPAYGPQPSPDTPLTTPPPFSAIYGELQRAHTLRELILAAQPLFNLVYSHSDLTLTAEYDSACNLLAARIVEMT